MSRAVEIFRGAFGALRERLPRRDGESPGDDPATLRIRELIVQLDPSAPAAFVKRFRVIDDASDAHERGLFVAWRGRGAYRRFRQEQQNLRSATERPTFPRWHSEEYLSRDLPELGDSGNGLYEEFAVKESVQIQACERCLGKKVVPCSTCDGKGRRDVQIPCSKCQTRPDGPSKRCKNCGGTGLVTENRTCEDCRGGKVQPCPDCEAKGWVSTFVVVSLEESKSETVRFIDLPSGRWVPVTAPTRSADFALDLTTPLPVQLDRVPEGLVPLINIVIDRVQREHAEKTARSKSEHDTHLGATLDRRVFSKFIEADLRLWKASQETVRWEYPHRRRNPFSNEQPKTHGDLRIISAEPGGAPEQIVWGQRPTSRFFFFFSFSDPGWERIDERFP